MPTYEYICLDCNSEFQCFVKTMDAAKPPCEKCGSKKVDRKLSVFGVGAAKVPASPAPGGCQGCGNMSSCPMAEGY